MIPNKILKTFAFEFAPIIADIYNSSISQGVFPGGLKRSFVVPVPKALPPLSIEDDLRPISLTSQIAKVMEGCTLDNLFPQIVDKLDPKQFALSAKKIHIDVDPASVSKIINADIPIIGSAKESLTALIEELKSRDLNNNESYISQWNQQITCWRDAHGLNHSRLEM